MLGGFFQPVTGHQLAVYDIGSSVSDSNFKAFADIPVKPQFTTAGWQLQPTGLALCTGW